MRLRRSLRKVQIGWRVRRISLHSCLKAGMRAGRVLLESLYLGERIPGFGILRILVNGLAQAGFRLIQLSFVELSFSLLELLSSIRRRLQTSNTYYCVGLCGQAA